MDPYSNTLYMLDEDYFNHEDLMIEAMAVHRQRHATLEASSSRRPNSQPHIFIRHNPLEGHERLWKDYFAQPPIYLSNIYRRRFRMNRDLFLRIHSAVETQDDYFVQKRDANGRLGLSSLQKMTATIRMLAYGIIANLMDEYVRIGESIARLSMKKFVKEIVSIFGGEYLRSPTSNDIARLLEVGQRRGFPGMLGSIDCMHWKWKNCPSAWKVKTIPAPHGKKKKHFAACEESARKDVERAFGVLQSRFAIVRGPARYFQPEVLKDIMYACIILHNMIVEDERHLYLVADQFNYEANDDTPSEPISRDNIPEFMEFIAQYHRIRDRGTHSQLQADLIEHLWNMHGRA
ncbi:uncharacterized protein LOC122316287 [Carya illinoinensis]|uniref:uncharacterized protein LOC122316287 n=1 Tax=Carya illinoinensis TaxID=32201 RepID=UPI001C71D1A0|nr:uncharacterized protein LOC122316287 [Carya illinoinensis]